MTIYDDMRGYVHTHDRNGWFDVIAKTTPMYQMIDKADAENAKLKELAKLMHETIRDLQETFDASVVAGGVELSAEYFETELSELGIEVEG